MAELRDVRRASPALLDQGALVLTGTLFGWMLLAGGNLLLVVGIHALLNEPATVLDAAGTVVPPGVWALPGGLLLCCRLGRRRRRRAALAPRLDGRGSGNGYATPLGRS